MTESKSEDQRTELALFRYSLILALLRQEYEPGGKADLLRQIAAGRYDIPGSKRRRVGVSTLRRWEQQYRQHGFDGLKPRPRSPDPAVTGGKPAPSPPKPWTGPRLSSGPNLTARPALSSLC